MRSKHELGDVLTLDARLEYAWQIASGMAHVEKNDLCHGSLTSFVILNVTCQGLNLTDGYHHSQAKHTFEC